MKTTITLILFFTALLSNDLDAQAKNYPKIYNFSNKESFERFLQRDLDSQHTNLLNLDLAKEDYDIVSKKWMTIHQDIGQYLKKSGFNWNTEDSTVSIVHKI